MKRIYINGTACVSAQNTLEGFLDEVKLNDSESILPLTIPAYKEYISPAMIRRMAKGVKNGIVASAIALKEAGITAPDAIITGTGMGCVEDSETFLKNILDNNEQHLTPTAFIQSTHNTVGAQVALSMGCKSYNFTYVNGAVSFESAMLDAMLGIQSEEYDNVLVGGVDETAPYTMSLFKLAGFIKNPDHAPYKVLNSETPGVVFGEGACFFSLSDKMQDNTYAEVRDLQLYNRLSAGEAAEKMVAFLQSNDLKAEEVDAVILGFNGDVRTDHYYYNLAENIFPDTQQLYYKHLSGEYNTASAFGLWVGAMILKTQLVPDVLKVNRKAIGEMRNIVLYNQYNGTDHSYTLISHAKA